MIRTRWRLAVAVVSFLGATNVCNAGTYSNDFSADIGAAELRGNAVLDSGSVRLTANTFSQIGSLVIDDLDPERSVIRFDASFVIAIGPGSMPPADGISFSLGQPPGGTGSFGENGTFDGLAVGFDLFDNMESPTAPAIRVFVNGVQIVGTQVTLFSAGAFRPVSIHLDGGGLDVAYNGATIFENLDLPGFSPAEGYQFTLGGRTGGATAEQRVDDVSISTTAFSAGVPALSKVPLVLLGVLLVAAVVLRSRHRRRSQAAAVA